MVFDTLLSESKADSVDICINNKTVQYKYKDSVFVCVCCVCELIRACVLLCAFVSQC